MGCRLEWPGYTVLGVFGDARRKENMPLRRPCAITLTDRLVERDRMDLLAAEGRENKDIAAELRITFPRRARGHRIGETAYTVHTNTMMRISHFLLFVRECASRLRCRFAGGGKSPPGDL